MRVHVMPVSAGGLPGHPLTGFVIDGRLAVDAGPLGTLPLGEQAAVADVLLTHAHIDHIAGLPVFLDNVYRLGDRCPQVFALPETLDALQADLFNGRLMPDFIGMSRNLPPFVAVRPVAANRPFAVGGYTVTPLPLRHSVPTAGYLIDDKTSAVAILTDTAPVARRTCGVGQLAAVAGGVPGVLVPGSHGGTGGRQRPPDHLAVPGVGEVAAAGRAGVRSACEAAVLGTR